MLKWCGHFGKRSDSSSYGIQTNNSVPLGTYPRERNTEAHAKTCTWIEHICPRKTLYMNGHCSIIPVGQKVKTDQMSMSGWGINKTCSMNPVEYYSAIKRDHALIQATTQMKLGNIKLHERCQSQRTKYCRLPLTGKVQNRQNSRDRKEINGCLGLARKVGCVCREVRANRCEVSFWRDLNVLKLTGVMVAHIYESCEHTKNLLSCFKNQRQWTPLSSNLHVGHTAQPEIWWPAD